MKQSDLETMLQIIAQRLGTSPEVLKESAKNGQLSSLLNQMSPADVQNLQRVLKDQEAARKILESPQAQDLWKKLNQK